MVSWTSRQSGRAGLGAGEWERMVRSDAEDGDKKTTLLLYRQHLLGRPIIVHTDHVALAYLTKTPEPIGQQGRWLDLLSEYDISIGLQHRQGRFHGNSDAFSRRPHECNGETDCRQCRRQVSGPATGPAFGTVTCGTGQPQPPDSHRPWLPDSHRVESSDLHWL